MGSGKTPKGARTKNRIIESAIKLIKERGIEKTNLVELCNESGVAQGTFYHYFKSVNDVLYEILRIEGEDLKAYYQSIGNQPPVQQLLDILGFQLNYFERKGKAIVAQILGNEYLPYSGKSKVEEQLPIRDYVEKIISEGQNDGIFTKENSPEHVAIVIISLLFTHTFLWIRDCSDNSLKEMLWPHITNIIEQLLHPAAL